MRALLCVLLAAAPLIAQAIPAGKPVEVDFKNLEAILKPPHFHFVPADCKGKPNRVFARQNGVYYACINGKEVCSEEKPMPIPFGLIDQFKAEMEAAKARMAEGREMARRAQEETKAAAASNSRAAEAARRAGSGAPGSTSVTVVNTATPAPDSAAPAPVADELVRGLTPGTALAAVVEKLGEPFMKISGETPCYTYRLASGDAAELEFEDGKLQRVRVVKPR